jgi:hypothetical protein
MRPCARRPASSAAAAKAIAFRSQKARREPGFLFSWSFYLRMIFSENRFTLFRIMR